MRVVPLPEPVWVSDDVEDWQPMIPITLTETQLPEDRWLKTIEAQADAECVHHIVVYSENPHQEVRTEAAGQLGYGNQTTLGDQASEMDYSLNWVSVGTGRTVLSVSTGYEHTCVILDNQTVKCWGYAAA